MMTNCDSLRVQLRLADSTECLIKAGSSPVQQQVKSQHRSYLKSCFVSWRILDSLGILPGQAIALSLGDHRDNNNEDIVLESVECEQFSSDANDEGIIHVSPITLHKMGLINSFLKRKSVHIWIYKPENILLQNASAVTLSRVAGYKYPSDDAEKKSLLRYFSVSQEVGVGNILCISRCRELFQEDDNLYLYFISDVESSADEGGNESDHERDHAGVIDSSDSSSIINNTSGNNANIIGYSLITTSRPRITITTTIKDKTAIALKGRTNCSTPDIKAVKDFIDIFAEHNTLKYGGNRLNSGPWTSARNLLEVSIVRFCDAMSTVLQLAYSEKNIDANIQSNLQNNRNINSSNYNSSNNCNSNSSNNNSNGSSKQYSVSDATLFSLIKSPTMVESTTGEEDMRIIVLGAGQRLGLSVVMIDARIILEAYSAINKNKNKEIITIFPPSYQDLNQPGVCYTADGATIVNLYSPCILSIENIDSIIFSESTGAEFQPQNEENEIQEIFAACLSRFFDDLWSSIADNAKMKNENNESSGDKSFREHLVSNMVLVTAATRNSDRFKKNLRSLFPSDFSLIPLPDSLIDQYINNTISRDNKIIIINETNESDEKEINKSSLNTSLNLNRYSNDDNVEVRKKILKVANGLSVEGGAGVSVVVVQSLIEQSTIQSALGCRSKAWLRECDLVRDSANSNRQMTASSSSSFPTSSSSSSPVPSHSSSSLRLPPTPIVSEKDVHTASKSLTRTAVSTSKTSTGAVKVSPVHWGDIGGLDSVRRDILDILQGPSLRPDLFPAGFSGKRGILLYGPPGTGKTLVARAVATECDMAFISVKGPELLDVYVGESERNVRELFSTAHRCAPCVLFFDELDSLAPARGRGSDGGGVMDRVVSQLLTEIDRLSTQTTTSSDKKETGTKIDNDKPAVGGVFIIGATNRPDLLDTALMRPGRFDKKIYLSVCKDVSARVQILEAQTRKFTLGADVILREIAALLPDTVTGADIGALSSSAYSKALENKLTALKQQSESHYSMRQAAVKVEDTKDIYGKEEIIEDVSQKSFLYSNLSSYVNSLPNSDLAVTVFRNDFLLAVQNVKPSVTRNELDHYEALGREFSDLSV